MRKPIGQKKRWGCLLLVMSVLGTQALFAHGSEKNFWDERRRESQKIRRGQPTGPVLLANVPTGSGSSLSPLPNVSMSLWQDTPDHLPRQFAEQHAAILQCLAPYGHVRKATLPNDPTSSRLVLLIQDVHGNAEAQRNIGQTVRTLIDRKAIGLVALEGAFDPLRLSRFRTFPDHETIQKVADYLLRENKISGPAHTALTHTGPFPPLEGIDDRALYRSNVKAYTDSAPQIAPFRQNLSQERAHLEQLKETVFHPKLREFDRTVEAYRRGAISLGAYVKWLATTGQGGFSHSPVNDFIKAYDMERALDFQRVEAERNLLVERLGTSLTQEQANQFIKQSAAYRLGQLRYADFYRSLSELCRVNRISLSHFPAMDAYVRYVLTADRISGEALFDALTQMELAGFARFAQTPEEKRLVHRSRHLSLTEKLLDFSLSSDEWREYETLGPGTLPLNSFEAFYENALARDSAMAKNLITAMTDHQTSTALLVAGGFHAKGIEDHLRRAGIAVLSVVPKIEKVDTDQGGASYLSVFAQEKTPLEKLFQCEKLFLSIPPLAPAVENGLAPVLAEARTFYRDEVLRLRDKPVGTTESTFKSLSADPSSASALVKSIKVSDTQVAVQVTVAKKTITTLVTFKGAKMDIDESHVLAPGQELTLERGQRLFAGIFHGKTLEMFIRAVWAPLTEWDFYSNTFLVNHHPGSYHAWKELIESKKRIHLGITLMGGAALPLFFLTALFFHFTPVQSIVFSIALTVPFSLIVGKVFSHSVVNVHHLRYNRNTATQSNQGHLTNPDAVTLAEQMNQNPALFPDALWKAWSEKMSGGNVFRYTLSDVERTTFPSSIKQFNPKRGGKRPRQMDTAQLNQPFDQNAFHFDSPKMNPQEILAEGCMLGDVEVDYVANVNPFGQNHILVTPERKKHHHQFFIPQAAKAAFRTLRRCGHPLKIGFNSVGAFASINHLHLQALPTHSKMFPVEAAFEKEGAKELLEEQRGVRLSHLTGWPTKPFVIEGADENAMVNGLMKIVDVLHNANQPYNLLFTLSPENHFRVFIFPRQPERASPFGTGLAFFEVAGEFLFVQPDGVSYEEAKALYTKTTESELMEALAEIRVADPVLAQLKVGFSSAIRNLSLDLIAENRFVSIENPAPPTNSLLYLLTRDWKMGWFGALLDGGILLGSVTNFPFSLIGVMIVLFSIHTWVAVKRAKGESYSHYLVRLVPRFGLHMLVAAPYAFIGTPLLTDPLTVMAVAWHLVYDGVLMRWDQIRLAQRDLRALGISVPENRVPPTLLNFLIPLEKSSVNDLDGRRDRLRQVSEQIKHGGPYASEWANTVDTVAHLSVVAPDDLPVLRAMVHAIQNTDDRAPIELLLVPGKDDPDFIAELQRITAGVHRVTLLTPTFEKGILRLSNRAFVQWANGKGTILWFVTKNSAVTPMIQTDDLSPHPALRQVMDLLRFAPPLRPIDFSSTLTLAIAILKFA